MEKLKIKMKILKAKMLAKKYQYFTISEGRYTTAIFFTGINKIIEF